MSARRIRIDRPGSYDRLRLEAFTPPSPGPGEVRIAVHAAGVNYADCIVRMGLYRSAKEYVGWPITPGFEIAGEIDAVGDGVAWSAGERVLAVTRFGGYASHVVVPARQVFAIGARDPVEAASFPAVFITAWFALFELANVRPGQHVLVHSAAGGVGSALVRLAKLAGCRVCGVVGGPAKVAECDADAVIDASRGDLWARAQAIGPDGFDVVLDANGASTLRESYAHLRRPGKLVVYGFASMLPRTGRRPSVPRLAWQWLRTPRFDPLALTSDCKSVLAFNLSYLFDEAALLERAMNELLGWWEAGRLTMPRVTAYGMSEVANAHRALESGRTIGKLALTVPEAWRA